jgi:hypothetical protein
MVTESISSITPVQHIFRNHILLRNCGSAADSSSLAGNISNVNAQWRARERSFWRTNGLGAAIRKRRTVLKIRVAKGLGVRMADLMRDCNI